MERFESFERWRKRKTLDFRQGLDGADLAIPEHGCLKLVLFNQTFDGKNELVIQRGAGIPGKSADAHLERVHAVELAVRMHGENIGEPGCQSAICHDRYACVNRSW